MIFKLFIVTVSQDNLHGKYMIQWLCIIKA